MKQQRSMKTIWATATLIVGGIGAWYVFSPDEETSPPPPPSPASNSASVKAPQSQTLTELLTKMAEHQIPSKAEDAITTPPQPEQSIKDCIGNFFYKRAKAVNATPDQRFSNLRWAAEMYGNTINAETLERTAQALSVTRAIFITELREAAQAVFWHTPTYNLHTDWDKLNYWNNQKLAHPFTGISNEGEFNDALAIAATQTTVEAIRANRDSFALNAVREIMPILRARLISIYIDYIENAANQKNIESSIETSLQKLSPEQQIEFRQQIELADYVIKTLPVNNKNAILSLGLSQELYDLMKEISQSSHLDFLISDQFAIECKATPALEQRPK